MAATWVSNSGFGTSPNFSTKISMSCRAAWNTFMTAWLAKSSPSGARSSSGACGVHHRDFMRAGQLHDAEFRPVGALAHEFGIDGDEILGAEPIAELLQRFGGGYQ